MDGRLIRLQAEDGTVLDGILYEPRERRNDVALLHLHGKGANALSGPGRTIPEGDRREEFAHLALNMRFHSLGFTKMDEPCPDFTEAPAPVGGGMWECVAEGVLDVAAGVAALRARGYERVALTGHSSGAFYAVQYCATDVDVLGRVLLSPLMSSKTMFPVWFPEPGRLEAVLEQAREMVAAGEGHLLLPLKSWYYAISAGTLLERAAERDDEWAEAFHASTAPLLVVWGSKESRGAAWQQAFDASASETKQRVAIEGAEHHYIGFEDELARSVLSFVARCAARRA